VNPPQSPKKAGFSLVEVALSVGIVAFAFVGLMSLLPAGLTTFRRALDVSICMQIAQRIVSEAQEADFDVLTDVRRLPVQTPGQDYSFRMRRPGTDETLIRYFDEQGNEVIPESSTTMTNAESARVVYAVNVRVIPRVTLPTGKEGFPTQQKLGQSGNLAQITVQIARNPTSKELPLSPSNASDPKAPERNLWVARDGIDIFTYSSYLGRNQ
jgi:uncharacterized protein (TIGR02598 family)